MPKMIIINVLMFLKKCTLRYKNGFIIMYK